MGYVEKSLAPGETVHRQVRLHWSLWLAAWAWLVFLGVFVIGIVFFVRDWARIATTEIAITNQRLIYKTGFLSRHTRELELNSVEEIAVDQSFWGRLFGAGRVAVHGTGEDTWRSPLIGDPIGFRRDLEAALSAVRR
jgi:uncharacterized membrane protein YdbT with pleckstrin-like domain